MHQYYMYRNVPGKRPCNTTVALQWRSHSQNSDSITLDFGLRIQFDGLRLWASDSIAVGFKLWARLHQALGSRLGMGLH